MKFSEYFESWVNQNYYANSVNIGKKGDFYTAVSVGAFFGICIAKKILKIYNQFQAKNGENFRLCIVEIGANEGFLLADIIQGIFTFEPENFKNFEFFIIEPHEILRQKQLENFKEKFGDEVKLTHFKSLNEAKFQNAVFIANELFDAFKCEIIDNKNMLFIENHKPIFKKAEPEILQIAKNFGIKKGEIPLGFENFAHDLRNSAENFAFISFDYGDFGAKNDFSIRIYKNHEVFNLFEIADFSEFYGLCDMTYDLNFKILSEIFAKNNIKMVDFRSQSSALVEFGATEILEMFAKKGAKFYQNALLEFKHLMSMNRFKMVEFRG